MNFMFNVSMYYGLDVFGLPIVPERATKEIALKCFIIHMHWYNRVGRHKFCLVALHESRVGIVSFEILVPKWLQEKEVSLD